MACYNHRHRQCEEGEGNVEAPNEPEEAPHQPEEACARSEASIATELTGKDTDVLSIKNARFKQELNEAQNDVKLAQSHIKKPESRKHKSRILEPADGGGSSQVQQVGEVSHGDCFNYCVQHSAKLHPFCVDARPPNAPS